MRVMPFAVAWGSICLLDEGSVASLGGALAFAALSALVGWLSFSESGRESTLAASARQRV